MLKLLLPILFAAAASGQKDDPASKQLMYYKENQTCAPGMLTTLAGAPVRYEDATATVNLDILNNEYLVDISQHFVRMRIPERIVHANGAGAFGYFETTNDISHICKANLFSKVGKKTPIAVRFSLAFARFGVSDTKRETRSIAIKFYTDEGNFDITTLNLPILAFKDSVKFPSLTNVMQGNAATNMPDNNAFWDYVVRNPESFHDILRLMSPHGMPDGWCHMEAFAIHTYQVYDSNGKSHFVRFQFEPEQGVKYMNATQISNAVKDPNYYARDLYNRIATGNYPSWKMQIQIVPEKVALERQEDIFDLTQELPQKEFKKIDVGRFVLTQTPKNFFADIEQLAYSPGNLVPGILGAPDNAFQVRRFMYRDAAIYRLGSNFKRIKVNRPLNCMNTYTRDGAAPVDDNGGSGPNYFPSSYGGPQPYKDEVCPQLIKIRESPKARNFKQVSDFFTKTLNKEYQDITVENIVEHMCYCDKKIKKDAVAMFSQVNRDLASRVTKALTAKCGY